MANYSEDYTSKGRPFDESFEEKRAMHKLSDPSEGPMSVSEFNSATRGIDEALRTAPSAVDPVVEHDPFGPDEVGGLQAIVLMRIYDVLFALLDEQNPDKATFIADLHRRGGLLMSSPKFTAEFLDETEDSE